MRENERRDDGRREPGVRAPEARQRHAERRDDEIHPDRRGRQQAAFAEALPAREPEHRRQQEMVDEDPHERGREAGKREAQLRIGRQHVVDGPGYASRAPGSERREGVVADVERLDVPGVPLLQPVRQMLYERHQGDELRRQQERARDHECDRGVEPVVRAAADEEELGDRRAGGEDRERHPLVRCRPRLHQRRDCGRQASDAQGEEVEPRKKFIQTHAKTVKNLDI